MKREFVVDAHAHVFKHVDGRIGSGRVRGRSYGLVTIGAQELAFMPPLSRSVSHSPEMLIRAMDWAGVQRAVLLQGPFYGECNDYAAEAVARRPDRFVAAAYFDPWSDDAADALEWIVARGVFSAVKIEMSEATGLSGLHRDARLADSRLTPFWRRLEEERLVLALDLGRIGERGYQTDAVREIATSFPVLRIVIAHLAQPSPRIFSDEAAAELWRDQLGLGRLPNVWFDTASLISYFPAEAYTFPSAVRVLEEAASIVGPDKIMWGSDMPSSYQVMPYPQLVDLFKSQIEFLGDRDRALICGETALEVYCS
jgi:predicted TIM-barrel fold metal-dependent hydrolase